MVSWADRCAYSAHDLEDAVHAGVVKADDLPDPVTRVVGWTRSSQLRGFISALTSCISETGTIAMYPEAAEALAALRSFNYERIYTRPESTAQGDAVIALLRALVDFYMAQPGSLPASMPEPADSPVRQAVAYVSGMTDRYAFETAITHLGWRTDRLPRGVDVPH